MKPVENHMVALPQPELDFECNCPHSYYEVIGIEDYDESVLTFKVRCVDCYSIGYVEASVKIEDEVEWH